MGEKKRGRREKREKKKKKASVTLISTAKWIYKRPFLSITKQLTD